MPALCRLGAVLLAALLVAASPPVKPPAVDPAHAEKMAASRELFTRAIRKTLTDNCLKCHGSGKTRGGLDLATRETLLKGTLSSRFYYVYAVDYDRGGEWAGSNSMCTADKLFTIRGTEDCQKRVYKRNGFFEVDTNDAKDWTIRLTEPGEGGAAPKGR